MGLREDTMAILHNQAYRQFPIVHFSFWQDTVDQWYREGHIPDAVYGVVNDNSVADRETARLLGFDYNWSTCYGGISGLLPAFETKVLEVLDNGQVKSIDSDGAIVLTKPGVVSIPTEVGHILTDRKSWEEQYLPRLRMNEDRLKKDSLAILADTGPRTQPIGLFCGSLYGTIRNWLGLEGSAYLQVDDEELFDEIINTFAQLQLDIVRQLLERGARPDFAHFWEDICCKSGPLINPTVFAEKVGPWYRRFTDLLAAYHVDIVSLDCDGVIDKLVPIWLENGVNTMFPIEVGVWGAGIAPWRRQYGPSLRGVGGMNKNVFAEDYAAVDQEIERLLPLIDLGGYIPCPDHRLPPTAKWENVQYYCDRLRRATASR